MKTFIISLSLFLILFFGSAKNSLACVCVPQDRNASLNQQVRDAYKGASAVFSGTIVGVDETSDELSNLVTIDVLEVWKGPVAVSSRIVIKTGKRDADCKFPFVAGQGYLVYSYFEQNWLVTNICLRTNILGNNPDLAILNKIVKRT